MYTGNSDISAVMTADGPVYPCVYRELLLVLKSFIQEFGLSLCIQGTHKGGVATMIALRFIPVYTGNSSPFNGSLQLTPVYPCVYRELDIFSNVPGCGAGLSLCIQGTLYLE